MDTVRRVRAARGAVNMSLDDFASAIGVGRQTLVRIENGSRKPRDHEYQHMADVSGLPLGFFYADLKAVLNGPEDPTLSERIAALEDAVSSLRAAMVSLAAGNVQRTQEQLETPDTGRQGERPGERRGGLPRPAPTRPRR